MLTVIPLAQDLAPSEASFNHSSVPTARRARVRAHYKLFTYFPLPFTSVFLEKFSRELGSIPDASGLLLSWPQLFLAVQGACFSVTATVQTDC